jgi:predicted patatin/cPLA2 family phospholipase
MNPQQRKIGLVIEGGAMRGVISMAFLTVLEKYRFTDAFDHVWGSSAGAMNAAYFLAGQAESGLALYLEDADSGQYFRKWRPWNMLDLDAILKKVTGTRQPLDCSKLRATRTKAVVPLTEARTGQGVAVLLNGTDERIYQVLRAAISIPPYRNTPVELDGHAFLDGGIADPVPINAALEAGCTQIVVLLTRPANFIPRALTWRERTLLRLAVLPKTPEFRRVFLHVRPEHYLASRRLALGQSKTTSAAQIWAFTPPAALPKVYRFGNDPGFLREVAQQCIEGAEKVVADPLFLLGGRTDANQRENGSRQLGNAERRVSQKIELLA